MSKGEIEYMSDYAKEKRSQIIPFFETDRVLFFMGKGNASIFFKWQRAVVPCSQHVAAAF